MTTLAAIIEILKFLPEVLTLLKKLGAFLADEKMKAYLNDLAESMRLHEEAQNVEASDPNKARQLRREALLKLSNSASRL